MSTEEVKMRIVKFINKTMDAYIPQSNVVDRLKNCTFKLWFEQNISRIDPILATFVDSKGELDIKFITHYYEEALFEKGEFKLDIRDLIPDDYVFIKEMLPNKLILFKKNDLIEIFE